MKIEINANVRELKGTGASRRLRHAGKTPGVLYGGDKEATSLEIDSKELFMQFRHEAFHASILTLNLAGKKEAVILRDFQMHPVRNNIVHIDFQRINENEKISVKVPFHFINEETAPGVKLEGGLISHIMTEIDISCLPKDLPQYIEVDMSALSIGDSIHLSEVKVPEGVELTTLSDENDPAITSISKPKVVVEEAVTAQSENSEEGSEEGSSGDESGDEKSDGQGSESSE
ncbi:50S ribosomal protein L25/general stress protein Ctc [Methylophilaceae bacterium]|jgi:large subunit ribosomal protein L25|nr:50S ribosomal protein L25/general stress protein Ctc [Betaproteobacteria bacterium]MDA9086063.1 50S ribosomal protein L25/general stress protein Ctc [Methylophilaceae bacterium]MCH9841823.1 50S ribosomal protein L25/general stress protein Ctc [Betaproteobacteria bacterium]MDA9096975.1 50S ribosomal protein L25/general stress protein Ctc [Methylophilaceae bacterium]MDC0877178.1 50S ribosomal protein L25/general stress protein Ctc [Methylophilaceae bacterium]